jgi:hypothetical protein
VISNRWFRPELASTGMVRFWLTLPEGANNTPGQIAISPNGQKVAMVLTDSAGVQSIWIHYFDTHSAQRLDQIEGAGLPFWSQDGQWIAFFSGDSLKKVKVSGGQPQTPENRHVRPGARLSTEEAASEKPREIELRSARASLGSAVEAGVPKMLFQTLTTMGPGVPFAASGDGRRFLFIEPLTSPLGRTGVILNWNAGLGG